MRSRKRVLPSSERKIILNNNNDDDDASSTSIKDSTYVKSTSPTFVMSSKLKDPPSIIELSYIADGNTNESQSNNNKNNNNKKNKRKSSTKIYPYQRYDNLFEGDINNICRHHNNENRTRDQINMNGSSSSLQTQTTNILVKAKIEKSVENIVDIDLQYKKNEWDFIDFKTEMN